MYELNYLCEELSAKWSKSSLNANTLTILENLAAELVAIQFPMCTGFMEMPQLFLGAILLSLF